ncbi:MAG TPA: methionine adenosyltransferase [Candidatus Omnitrophica bacterium]|nr:MAG: methionine adenosyltransferase [Omnitrophica WOR_2 bacterium GWA2_63_20]OGX17186.1 MAG: methionine adenosyltransferase [Omnitrophica WOR_2 bacterium GWF2_63_9]OGX31361.1 MAG: methionine adenosyltransferase [Omnitrophica WOR_2 bacterium RIFCSPHIGHO2_12_FULL_64_13]OGX34685.1 MAG: methionine adenosyltransferase [Omnitrophica WOR_2 bacterium RIFCSPHIGHO2_02_FULL_63_39]OGX44652.1 MAG: methionine adenosyltransferase [Omnitrophica WOR_2 bacterium RIFCSPLOWO2_02_FULL_63_16]OGX49222.1 MAG: meth
MRKTLFTSESVTEGHPDKIADQISDAVLDAIYEKDPSGRVACETLVTTGLVVVAGEITTSCYIEIPQIVRRTIHEIGYDEPEHGFAAKTCGVSTSVQAQSPDIALGVDKGGAGDQGMMFGYATNETPEYMPMPIILAHRLAQRLAEVRKQRLIDYLRPDGKTQVTVEYHDGHVGRIEAVIVSAHHRVGVPLSKIRSDMKHHVIEHVVPKQWLDKQTKIFVNPTGRFEVGGPMGDTGLTGRKIIMDTYGGVIGHGGGAFSGKDPTKVDRSAAYMARYVAKNLVAAGVADKCEIQLAYAIGVAEPVSIMVSTHGSGKLPEHQIIKMIRELFDLTPHGIIRTLKLRRPIYLKTAAYGHFGRTDDGFTWEELDRVNDIKRAAKHH